MGCRWENGSGVAIICTRVGAVVGAGCFIVGQQQGELGCYAKIVAEVGYGRWPDWLQLPSETCTKINREGRKERKVYYFISLRSLDEARDKPLRALRFNQFLQIWG